MLLGYGAKVGLGNMRVKAENRMVTCARRDGAPQAMSFCLPKFGVNLFRCNFVEVTTLSGFNLKNA